MRTAGIAVGTGFSRREDNRRHSAPRRRLRVLSIPLSLEEKIGQSMAFIHAPVPTLNDDFGNRIDGFLMNVRPGVSWERVNWGIAATPARDLHPATRPPAIGSGAELSGLWLRVEWQSLVALPDSDGVLFGHSAGDRPAVRTCAGCGIPISLASQSLDNAGRDREV